MDQLQERLAVAVVAQPDPFVVQLAGEIDIDNAEQIAALATHPDNGHGTVVFDLAGVAFLGRIGIGVFLVVADAACQFHCRNACSVVARVLRKAGFDEWLEQPLGQDGGTHARGRTITKQFHVGQVQVGQMFNTMVDGECIRVRVVDKRSVIRAVDDVELELLED